jgi:hypothetical protein
MKGFFINITEFLFCTISVYSQPLSSEIKFIVFDTKNNLICFNHPVGDEIASWLAMEISELKLYILIKNILLQVMKYWKYGVLAIVLVDNIF